VQQVYLVRHFSAGESEERIGQLTGILVSLEHHRLCRPDTQKGLSRGRPVQCLLLMCRECLLYRSLHMRVMLEHSNQLHSTPTASPLREVLCAASLTGQCVQLSPVLHVLLMGPYHRHDFLEQLAQ